MNTVYGQAIYLMIPGGSHMNTVYGQAIYLMIPGGSHMNAVYKLFTESFFLIHDSSYTGHQVMLKHTISALSLPPALQWLSAVFRSEVLDILAKPPCKCSSAMKVMTDQLEHLKGKKSDSLSSVEPEISLLKEKHNITLGTHGSAIGTPSP